MTTRAIIITKKYTELTDKLKEMFETELIPSLDNLDVADIEYLITMTFIGIEKEKDFEEEIRTLIINNNLKDIVTEDQTIVVTRLISQFVLWLRVL
jgi:hypothetical protein